MVTYAIYPPIGIARVGDSPEEWFIGPELPGADNRPPGGYKSADCRIKRQGARFRIFECDDEGQPIVEDGHYKEVTAAQAQITWKVTLANIKAAGERYYTKNGKLIRNKDVPETERWTLRITPPPASISGTDKWVKLEPGKFRSAEVKLGELRTDEAGRLIVLGGLGRSAGLTADGLDAALSGDNEDSYDNDDWYDDVSDGPVTAELVMDGKSFTATPARVVVAPPHFAPPVLPVRSLYDVLLQTAIDLQGLAKPTPSWRRDLEPLLRAVVNHARVTDLADGHHGSLAACLADPLNPNRGFIASRLRPPGVSGDGTEKANMPRLKNDNLTPDLTLTKFKYEAVQAWAAAGPEMGGWINDPAGPDTEITPDGLTRAALGATVGGGLHPGIEAGAFIVDPVNYDGPFRLKPDIAPGMVTARMAVPWQGDFFQCHKEYGGDGGYFGWWPTHRPDQVYPEDGDKSAPWAEGITEAKGMVDGWATRGFVTLKDGALVQTERTVTCHHCSVIAARPAISRAEADAAVKASGGVLTATLYVKVGGSKPAELGIDPALSNEANAKATAPVLVFKKAGQPFTGFDYQAETLTLQNPAKPGKTQVVTYQYALKFADTTAFAGGERQDIAILASKAWNDGEKQGTATGEGMITLTDIATPYMLDGSVAWLSQDVKVFKVVQGDPSPIPGIELDGAGPEAALGFIDKVVGKFNGLPHAGHPFDALSGDQQESALDLTGVGGVDHDKPVYDFAVARVRFKGALPAEDVRVFFRLFTTAATGMDYEPDAAYRTGFFMETPRPLLGLSGGKLVSMPFFGRARIDSAVQGLQTQSDDLNVRTLQPPAAGQEETHAYFGCWLDINQDTPQFQQSPSPPDGPWPDGRMAIKQLINGDHQCLVAEIAFVDQPIPKGATPAGDARLAQRNLAWSPSDNPGGPESRTVQHSFEIKADRTPRTGPEPRPHELMILRSGLPAGTRMQVYMPDVDAAEVVALAARTMDYTGLAMADPHTLECLPGEATYIPLPNGRTRNSPALITLELPDGVRAGQQFRLVAHQVAGDPRRVLGSFQIDVPVGKASRLLGPETRRLSLLRYIAQGRRPDDPWLPVLQRCLGQVAARVKGFGGDPDKVAAAADGNGKTGAGLICRLLGGLFALAMTALVTLGGMAAAITAAPVLAATGAAVLLGLAWVLACKPSPKRFGLMLGAGTALGAAVLGLLALAGLGGPHLAQWLEASAAFGVLILLAALAAPGP